MPKGIFTNPKERSLKLSLALKGRVINDDWKKKMSESGKGKRKGNKNGSGNKGKKRPPFSDEWKRKLSEAHKGKPSHSWNEESRNKLRLANLGKLHSEETKKKISENNGSKGKPAWNKGKKGLSIAWNKGLKGFLSGEKHYNWKGGLSSENQKIRTSTEYRLWIKSVYERDNFTCQKYGTRGGNLVAHHINNFSEFPELRLAIDNGITLSEKAHKEFHKRYGVKNNTRSQIEEFISIK